MNCEICGKPIKTNGRTCSRKTDTKIPKCYSIFLSRIHAAEKEQGFSRQNPDKKLIPKEKKPYKQKTYTCPYCLFKFETSISGIHCDAWDCRLAHKQALRWGIAPEEYQYEFKRRNDEQNQINRGSLNAIIFSEKISCLEFDSMR